MNLRFTLDGQPIEAPYTNWRGETRRRAFIPLSLWFGSTDYHPEPQWLLQCLDVEKNEIRDMALSGFSVESGISEEKK